MLTLDEAAALFIEKRAGMVMGWSSHEAVKEQLREILETVAEDARAEVRAEVRSALGDPYKNASLQDALNVLNEIDFIIS